MQKIYEDIGERAKAEAKYIIDNQTTVRATAQAYDVSKSTVHMDVTKRLERISLSLHEEVQKVLKKNKDERAKRGGAATQRKYLNMKKK